MQKRTALPLIAALAAGIAGTGGWYWWAELRFVERTDNAYLRGDLATVSPRVAGHVAAVEAGDNRPLRRGDVLVRLDERDFRARAAEAEARLEARRAAVRGLEGELRVQATRTREAEAALASVAAQAVRAEADLARYARLAERRNASAQQLESARADAERDRAAVAAAEAGLEATRDGVPVLEARRAAAESERAMAEAALELARSDLENSVLRAPIDGVVGNRGVQVGDYVRVGARLMAVVPVAELYVEANFKETQLRRVRVGAPVRLRVDAYPDTPIDGTVVSLAPASGSTFSLLPAENATGNFTKVVQRVPVRIELPPDHPLRGLLRPGLSVVVTADLRRGEAGGTGGRVMTGVAQAAEPPPSPPGAPGR
jgi:membrane fusion protein (multidrug efflux system)